MAEIRFTKKDEEQLREQVKKYQKILNFNLAPIAIGGSFAALTVVDFRALISWLTLVILFSYFFFLRHEFPKIIEQLREKERTPREEILLRGITSFHFGYRKMFTDFAPFTLSMLLVTCIASGAFDQIIGAPENL